MATKQHIHIVAEDKATGRPFERVETDGYKATTARQVIVQCGGRILRDAWCRKPIAECRKPENLIGGTN